jgi:hypothetical protein
MKLDRSRPFAQTIGDSVARFHQDGRDFDCNGEEINPAMVVTFVEPPEVVSVPTFVSTVAPEPVKRKPGRPAKVTE